MEHLLFILAVLSTCINITVTFFAWGRRNAVSAKAFIALMAGFSLYSFGYAFELASPTLDGKLFWLHVEYLGIPFLPAVWITMVFQYAGHASLLKRPVIALMYVVPVIVFAAFHTNPIHHLFYATYFLDYSAPFPVVSFTKGPIYLLHTVYTNAAIAVGNLVYISVIFNSASLYRKQAAVMLGGTLLPWAVYAAYLLGVIPWHIDPNPFAFSLVGLIYAIGLFRYRMLKLVPMARAAVFDRMRNGILVFDPSGSLIDFNRSSTAIFPFITHDRIGTDVADLLAPHPAFLRLYSNADGDSGEIEVAGPCGTKVYSVTSSTSEEKKRTICRIFEFADITRQADLLGKLKEMASIDQLTGIWNRRFLLELGDKEISRLKRSRRGMSVIIADIDRFKSINDTFGHANGDAVLKSFAETVRGCLRTSDIFSRYGGEEFVILLPETSPESAAEIAGRIRAKIQDSAVRSAGITIRFTASFGVYGEPIVAPEQSLSAMIDSADKALYDAKNTGRNRVCCAPSQTQN